MDRKTKADSYKMYSKTYMYKGRPERQRQKAMQTHMQKGRQADIHTRKWTDRCTTQHLTVSQTAGQTADKQRETLWKGRQTDNLLQRETEQPSSYLLRLQIWSLQIYGEL